MKIFVTGVSGFIGSAVVKELLSAGHQVIGLARSGRSAKIISELGAEVLLGSLEDLKILKQGNFAGRRHYSCGIFPRLYADRRLFAIH